MAYFAKVVKNKVVRIKIATQEHMDNFIDDSPGNWYEVSRGTKNGIHYTNGEVSEDQSLALRQNFPSAGFLYNAEHDVFYPPCEYPSWTLNETTWQWEPPVDYPEDYGDVGVKYTWNEETQAWDAVESE
jgi:hypothetical protein